MCTHVSAQAETLPATEVQIACCELLLQVETPGAKRVLGAELRLGTLGLTADAIPQ